MYGFEKTRIAVRYYFFYGIEQLFYSCFIVGEEKIVTLQRNAPQHQGD